MNKITKRIISLQIIAAMIITLIPVIAGASMNIQIGQYVQMGTYYGEPILWRCVDIDENGPLMLSDKILCIKAFDAEGSNNTATGSHSRNSYRQSHGSNYWGDSNMRSWLNSTASAGNVHWLCGNPPVKERLWRGYNAYDQEAGFLSNFTQSERNAMNEVTQKSLLSSPEIDAGMAATGTEGHDYGYHISDVVSNYDTAYAEYISDKLFLLDVKQANAVYNNRGVLGGDYYIGEPTAQCVANSEYKDSDLNVDEKWYSWLRSPNSNSINGVRVVYSDGYVNDSNTDCNYVGVRPAFYLNLSSSIRSGSGTASNPYTITGGGSVPSVTPAPVVTPAPQISVNDNYSGGDDLIKKAGIDVNNLLSDISVGTDKIKGPKISILGKDFYLFELDGKCSLKLGSITIQLKVNEEKNSIQLLGGYDFLSESMSAGSSYTKRDEWKKAYDDLKSLHHALAGGKFTDNKPYQKYNSVYSKLKKHNSNLFLNIKGNFALYGEIAWDNGSWKMIEGGGILKASASGSIDPRIGGIFYGTFGVTVDTSGKFAVKFEGVKQPMSVESKLTIEPAVNVGIGAGSKKAKFYIEGGLKGKLPIDIAAVTGSFKTNSPSITPLKVTAKGYIYISGKAGIFGADKEWQLGDDAVLYPRNGGEISLQSVEDTIEEVYTLDKSDFKLLPRDYGQGVSLMSVSDELDKYDLYPYSSPKLAKLSDGRKILLWIDDDPSKADADRTSMYYSIYTPDSSSWSTEQIAINNIGYNELPQIAVDENKVHIVWTCVDEAMGDTADIDDMSSRFNLYYTCFDGENFSAPELISEQDNGLCEMLYAVSENNGTVTVAWAENSANDLALSDGTNSIYKRTMNNGVWSGTEVVAAINTELHDIQLTKEGKVVYETIENEKTELYLNGKNIGESENDHSAFQVGYDEIYYISNDTLNIYNIETDSTDAQQIGEITDITILNDGNKKIALSLLSTGFTNELYQNECINGKWGEWTQLTEYNKYIRDYSAVVENGSLTVALNLVNVKDEEKGGYGEAELKVASDCEYSDIILGDAPYYDGEVKENGAVDIYFNVTNNSRNKLEYLNYDISGENIHVSDTVKTEVAPGETGTVKAVVTIPEGFKKQDLTITVLSDFEENNINNNTAQFTMGYADIEIDECRFEKSGEGLKLIGSVNNIGFENAENVTLNIYDSDVQGTLLKTAPMNTVAAENSVSFDFELPQGYLTNSEGKKSIYVEAVTDSPELEIGNNSDRIVMSDLSDIDGITRVSMSYENNILTIKSPIAFGADFVAAYYNEDGSLLTCRKLELGIGIGTNNIAVEGLTAGKNVKCMLWDKNMQPMCECLTWE